MVQEAPRSRFGEDGAEQRERGREREVICRADELNGEGDGYERCLSSQLQGVMPLPIVQAKISSSGLSEMVQLSPGTPPARFVLPQLSNTKRCYYYRTKAITRCLNESEDRLPRPNVATVRHF